MNNGEKTVTPAQRNRRRLAQKLVDVLSDLDTLLHEEVIESEGEVPSAILLETLIRKLHVGPIPLPCRIKVIEGQASLMINEDWVSGGYFKNNFIRSKAYG